MGIQWSPPATLPMRTSPVQIRRLDAARIAREHGGVRIVGLGLQVPVFLGGVSAGDPAPVESDLHEVLDVGHVLGTRGRTYVVRADGDSMTGDGIASGDALVIDVDAEAAIGDVIVAVVGGELTVKRLRLEDGAPVLVPANPAYPSVAVTDDVEVWGVVVSTVRSFRRS